MFRSNQARFFQRIVLRIEFWSLRSFSDRSPIEVGLKLSRYMNRLGLIRLLDGQPSPSR